MSDGRTPGANTSVGRIALRGAGPRSGANRAGNMVTSALEGLATGSARGNHLVEGGRIGRLKVRVPHDADARQIEQALRAALRDSSGRGRRSG